MSAARKPAARPHRLVLVRGGLDARDGDGDAEWEDFCRRIGWQTPAPDPGEDFERRIAEGLFSKPITPDNVIDLDLERDARRPGSRDLDRSFASGIRRSVMREIELSRDDETPPSGCALTSPRAEDAAEADLTPEIDADRLRRGWARAGAAALALAVAAAVLLAVTRLAFSPAPSPGASIAAPSAEIARDVAARPTAERAVDEPRIDVPVLPSKVAPLRTARPEGPTAKPAPAPKAPRDAKPEPPGMLVARRSPDASAKDRVVTVERAIGPDSMDADLARAADSPSVQDVNLDGSPGRMGAPSAPIVLASRAEPGAAQPVDGIHTDSTSPWGASSWRRVAQPAADAAPVRASADVWSNAPSAADPSGAERARPSNASWSLSGAGDRWVGAALTPPPAFAQASIGVMVQLDLGKALGKL